MLLGYANFAVVGVPFGIIGALNAWFWNKK
jgi:hypothetical protein